MCSLAYPSTGKKSKIHGFEGSDRQMHARDAQFVGDFVM
jgi:hypothetical protein